ncbi:shikimate dehydrogenase [Bacillus solimangrovi]|uniref:Shikimate dehydrogenase (NADP(+)) n=1 Tax=Bacillus solimangrovi TaxID=1305675 RepID=A0A1E5LHW1_9BACI|nr:shikimate dehydrogenase [Bacillus solimangrovi]OEH93672.1 shikimate dehydrogenase [Bacillus solimangrovi]
MGELFGLLGHPVSHSMSPLMHNDAFNHLELPYYYQAFDVAPNDLAQAVNGLRVLNVKGFNVTIPHKVAIMDLLDEIDDEAVAIGAVNTVVNEGGKLKGYNTDGQGYVESLIPKLAKPLSEQKVLVVGAGGAARAIFVSLAKRGVAQLDITNRTEQKAESIVNSCPYSTISNVKSIQKAEVTVNEYDVLIQTTAVGMSPDVKQMPMALDNLESGKIVSDIIYNPIQTAWLQTAEAKGSMILNGIGMFVGQGALSFEKWTGLKPDKARMEEIVKVQLGG